MMKSKQAAKEKIVDLGAECRLAYKKILPFNEYSVFPKFTGSVTRIRERVGKEATRQLKRDFFLLMSIASTEVRKSIKLTTPIVKLSHNRDLNN